MENESIPLRSILRAARVAFGNASCSSSSRTTIIAHHHHHHRRNTTTTPDDKRQSNASQEWRYFSSPGKISPPWKEWASLCIMFVYLYWCVCCLLLPLLLLLLLLQLPAELYIDSRGVVFFRWTADRLFKTETMATGETFSLHNSITRSHISEEKKSTPAREASVRKLSLTVWFVFVVVPRKQRFNNTKARWKKREKEREKES